MPTDCISFKDTGYFSELILDYLEKQPELHSFYGFHPSLDSFKKQIEKKASFSDDSRSTLVSVLKEQYKDIRVSEATAKNIEALKGSNSFTVTTGHQLNLFTGPMYFLYKIVSTINLTKQLKKAYPNYNFLPIYWMATEDHDFDEINFFNFEGVKIQWNTDAHGAVGRLGLNGLNEVFEVFKDRLGTSSHAKYLINLFKTAYLENDTLANATRYLANELFRDYGLVVADADDANLKRQFIPYMTKEIQEQIAFKTVAQTNKELNAVPDKNYNIQVNPREINLFYLDDDLRERIVLEDGRYSVLNTNLSWTQEEILKEINQHPEKFSPNVLLRPLYQEVILPNLCYIGGGGELAYWLQLKSYFDAVEVPFPIILLRNSLLIQTAKQSEKLNKLNISNTDIFLEKHALINKKVRQISNIDIDFTKEKAHLQDQFKSLYKLAEQTDKSFLGAVAAQERKQIKGLENLEKRLFKAQKRKLSDHVERVSDLKEVLFPNGNLQERTLNFSEFYLEYGETLIPTLIEHLHPLEDGFLVLSL